MKFRLRLIGSAVVWLGTVLGFGVSLKMLARWLGPSSPWLGLAVMVDLLGLAKVTEPFYLLRMPAPLRNVRPWEQPDALYRRLGVPHYGRFLRETPVRFLNLDVYLAGRRMEVARLYQKAEAAEAAHFWAAAFFTPFIGYVAARGSLRDAAVLVLVQFFFNLYPILHLRMVRGRLAPLVQRSARRRGDRTGKTDSAPTGPPLPRRGEGEMPGPRNR